VQRGVADPGAPGDLDQADTQPLVGKSLRGGGEDPVPVLPGAERLPGLAHSHDQLDSDLREWSCHVLRAGSALP